MFLRAAILSCATAMIVSGAAAALAEAREPARASRCEETTLRIYFQHDSAALDATATQLLAAAERNVAACSHRELHVMVDTASPRAAARGQAIRAAANARAWNVVRVERRPAMQRAAYGGGPDFAEVVMTPNVLPARDEVIAQPDVGV